MTIEKEDLPHLTGLLSESLEEEKSGEVHGFYDWASNRVDPEIRQWDESGVHVSDYSVTLSGDGKHPLHLWKRIRGHEQKENTPGEKLMFHQGNMLEEFACYLLEREDHPGFNGRLAVAALQFNVSEQLPKDDTGVADLVLSIKPEGYEYFRSIPVEIKTRRGNFFKYNDSPKESDITQLKGYMGALSSPIGGILVIDREGSNFIDHYWIEEEFPERELQKMSKEANRIANMKSSPDPIKPDFKIHQNKGPNRVSIKIPWQARYCDFKDCCEITQQYEHGANVLKYDDGKITKVYPEFKGSWIVTEFTNQLKNGEIDE